MGKIAFLFAGQGSQYKGMGKELYDSSPAAKEVFELAERMRHGTMQQCFEGEKEELSQTINTQPCIFCVDLAAAAALAENGVHADMVAGFSLGEIPALAFSGALPYEEAFSLVCERAKFMQLATEHTNGTMAAVLGLSNSIVESICSETPNVYPVNYNCDKQVVIAGEVASLDEAILKVKQNGGKAIKLSVSGAFHSPLMSSASQKLDEYLATISMSEREIPLYSNVTANVYGDKSLLSKQVQSPVLWQKTIENMVLQGADTFIEVGPGKVLSGLAKKIVPTAHIYNVENKESLHQTLEGLKNAER